jgi:hypothetical protein
LVRFCKREGGEELTSMRIDTIIKQALGDQWFVLGQTVMIDEALLDNANEVVVQAGVGNEDDYLGCPVPVFVDSHEAVES